METVRYSLEILTKQIIDEQTRENFTLTTPSQDEYKRAEPYFTKYGITPEEAFNVLDDFDIKPADLSKDKLNTRIRALVALDNALNDEKFISLVTGLPPSTSVTYITSTPLSSSSPTDANISAVGAISAGSISTGDALSASITSTPAPRFSVGNVKSGIVLLRRLISLLIMESASACSTENSANCFDDILGNPKFANSISKKIDEINKTNNQTIMSLKTDLNDKSEKNKEFSGIIQLDRQTIKSFNTMLSEKNNEIEKRQNENAELSKMYKSVFAERDAMVEKNKILVDESKKLITIPNVLIAVLVCIIAYLFVTKK